MSIEVAPEVQLRAAERRLRSEDANFGHQVVMDLALDLERRIDVDARRRGRGDLQPPPLRDEPLRRLRLGQVTQTVRHSFRRVSSENSERSSARPYLHENGET